MSRRRRPSRSNSGTPTSACTRASARDSADWLTWSLVAAAVTCSHSATTTNQRSSSKRHRRGGDEHLTDAVHASDCIEPCIGRILRPVLSSIAMSEPARHRAGEPGFRRAAVALFAAGLATFALLFSPQALLPLLSERFDVTPAAAALVLAVTTAALGLSLVPAGWLADTHGRTRVMGWSLLASALLGLACAAAPSFAALLVLRALQGDRAGGAAGGRDGVPGGGDPRLLARPLDRALHRRQRDRRHVRPAAVRRLRRHRRLAARARRRRRPRAAVRADVDQAAAGVEPLPPAAVQAARGWCAGCAST